MRGGLKFRILVVGIIAAAACLVAAGAGIADTTNADPTGDAKGGAPDITQVVTSNDAAGVITFQITTVAPIIDSSEIGHRPRYRFESRDRGRRRGVPADRGHGWVRDREVERHDVRARRLRRASR